MRLHSPELQSRLRRAVRSTIRNSPVLATEARRHRKQHRRQYTADYLLLRAFGTGWLLVLLMMGPLRYRLTALALWGLASALTGANRLLSLLEGDPERRPLLHLPVADEVVCSRQGWKFVRGGLWMWADGIVAYGLLRWGAEWPGAVHWAWVPVLAAMHWLLALALSVAVAQRPWLARHAIWILLALWGGFLAVCIPSSQFGPWLAAQFAEGSDWITLVLPTGWPAFLLSHGLAGGQWSTWILLAPMAVMVWIGVNSWKEMRAEFFLQDLDSSAAGAGAPEDGDETLHAWPAHETPGPTALVDSIRSREFLCAKPVWNPGDGLERLAARWCTPREQLLAEVGMESSPGWSPSWRKALVILLTGNLIAWGWQQLGLKFFGWLDGLILIVVAATVLPTQLNAAPALVGILPIRLGELLRLRTKLWLIRSLSAVPLFAAGALILGGRLHWPLWNALAVGLKGALLLQALFPYASVLGVGRSERFSFRLHSMGFWLLFLLCGGSTFCLSFGALVPELSVPAGGWISWLCVPVAILPGWGFAAVYLRRFNGGRVDLDLG